LLWQAVRVPEDWKSQLFFKPGAIATILVKKMPPTKRNATSQAKYCTLSKVQKKKAYRQEINRN